LNHNADNNDDNEGPLLQKNPSIHSEKSDEKSEKAKDLEIPEKIEERSEKNGENSDAIIIERAECLGYMWYFVFFKLILKFLEFDQSSLASFLVNYEIDMGYVEAPIDFEEKPTDGGIEEGEEETKMAAEEDGDDFAFEPLEGPAAYSPFQSLPTRPLATQTNWSSLEAKIKDIINHVTKTQIAVSLPWNEFVPEFFQSLESLAGKITYHKELKSPGELYLPYLEVIKNLLAEKPNLVPLLLDKTLLLIDKLPAPEDFKVKINVSIFESLLGSLELSKAKSELDQQIRNLIKEEFLKGVPLLNKVFEDMLKSAKDANVEILPHHTGFFKIGLSHS